MNFKIVSITLPKTHSRLVYISLCLLFFFQMPAKKNSVSKGVVQDGPGEDGNSMHHELKEDLKEVEEIKEEAKEELKEGEEIKEEAKEELKEGEGDGVDTIIEGIEKLSMADIVKALKYLPKSELRKVFNETKLLLGFKEVPLCVCGKKLVGKFKEKGACVTCAE